MFSLLLAKRFFFITAADKMSFPQDRPNPGWWKGVSQKFTKVFTAFLDHHKPDGANTGGDPPVLPGVVIPPVPPLVVAIPPVVQPAVANPSARLAVADTTNPLTIHLAPPDMSK